MGGQLFIFVVSILRWMRRVCSIFQQLNFDNQSDSALNQVMLSYRYQSKGVIISEQVAVTFMALGNLRRPQRQRQRKRRQTKGLMSKTIAVHVRYKSLYISLPSSAKQQREMTKFCVF